MLPRRHLLATAASLTTGVVAASARGSATDARTLRLGYLLPVGSQLGAGATVMAKEVTRSTDGRIRIMQFPGAALGGEVEMLKAVQRGRLDLAFITGAALPTVLPTVGVFNIPFLFKSTDHAHAVLDGPIGDAYRQDFAAKDLVALAWGENGLRHITNDKRPVNRPEDLRGLRLRVPQSEVMLQGFKALGANVASLPFPQLYDALRLGMFDAEENPIATILAAGLNRVQKFLTLSGHVYDPALLVMAAGPFDELSIVEKEHLVAAAKLGALASRRAAAEAEQSGVAALHAAGMTIVADIDRPRFAAGMVAAVPGFEALFGHVEIARIRGWT